LTPEPHIAENELRRKRKSPDQEEDERQEGMGKAIKSCLLCKITEQR